jgi:NADPH:quinone reductase-like Zn-dependent oxidoreductase
VVETVGGNVLSTAIRACYKHGNVAVCGNAFSHELNISVYPFILNGVNLLGIDSATSSMEIRKIIWERLANDWRPNMLEMIGNEITIDQLPAHIKLILKGKIRGRVVVNMK